MTLPQNPKLRSNLHLSQIDQFNYSLSHPETDATCYLDDVGYIVAEQFETGGVSVSQAVETLKSKYGLKISERQILDFLGKADSLGFLEEKLSTLGIDAPRYDSNELEFRPVRRFEAENEAEELKPKSKSLWEKIKKTNSTTLMVYGVGICLLILPWPYEIEGPIQIIPYEEVLVRSPISSSVVKVLVREGDIVEVDQNLIELEGTSLKLARLKAEIQKVDAELQKLKNGATKEEALEAAKKLELAEQILSQAKQNHLALKSNFEKGLVSNQEVISSMGELEIKTKEYEQAQASFQMVKMGTRKEVLLAKNAEKQALLVDLKNLGIANSMSIIKSPIQGVVSTPDAKLLERKMVEIGEPLIKIINPSKLTVMMNVSEKKIGEISLNQKMKFKTQTFPGKTITAYINRIAPTVESHENDIMYSSKEHYIRIYADVDNSESILKPGMTGYGTIRKHLRPLAFHFFYDFIITLRVKFVL